MSDKTSAEEPFNLFLLNRNRRETSRDVAAGVRRRRLQSAFRPTANNWALCE